MVDIHPTAVVSPEAELGAGVLIGPHAVVEAGVTVGEGTRIMAGAYICTGTTLGRGNEVHMHAVLGHVPQDTHFSGGDTFLQIGDRNVFREMVTVHRGTQAGSSTRVGSGTLLMACSHVAHNCTVADGAILANGALLAGHVEVGERAFVSGNALVHQFTRLGRLAMVAGGARATRDVPPFCLTEGENRLRDLNRIGLRRFGMTAETIAALGRAYRRLFLGTDSPDSAARAMLSEDGLPPEAREMAEFLLASERGVCRPRRPRRGRGESGSSIPPDGPEAT